MRIEDNTLRLLITHFSEAPEQYDAELVCKHHNTEAVVYMITDRISKQSVIMKISSNQKLADEAEFLKNHQDLTFIPEVFQAGKLGHHNFLIMEYLGAGYMSFSDLYRGDRLEPELLKTLLELLRSVPTHADTIAARQIYNEHYIRRLTLRLQLVRQSYLSELLSLPVVTINGKLLENLGSFWDRVLPVEMALSEVGPYPGDTHFEHVFVAIDGSLKIIDPKGAQYLPLVYDLGKILHSVHGGYDSIKALKFELEQLTLGKYEFSSFFPMRRRQLLMTFDEDILSAAGKTQLKQSYLSELFHFSSLIGHHLKVPREALGFYCRTVQLIDEFKNRFDLAE